MQPKIAAVIPAYNAEDTIGVSIRSVLNQALRPEEVIVVDDGSTDGTVEVVKRFEPHVRLIRQENQGSAAARQAGTDAAISEYIAYLDADDWWPENKIARCREIIAAESVDFLLADLQRSKPDDTPEKYLPRNSTFFAWANNYIYGKATIAEVPGLYKLKQEDGLNLLLHGYPVFPSTMLVKKRAVELVGGWDARFRRCQDFDIGLRLARQFCFYYLDEVQAILGIHEGNSNGLKYILKQTEGDIKVLSAHLSSYVADKIYKKKVNKSLCRKYCALGYAYREYGDYKKASQFYRKAMLFPGRRIHSFIRMLWYLIP